MPVYYRLLPGNIREVKAFKNSLIEAGLKRAVIIADKGFYSKDNIEMLEKEKLKYVIPLKRDNTLINYDAISKNTFKQKNLFFEHEGRIIWYRKYKVNNKQNLFVYLDESLRLKEERDYLKRISTHPESYTMEGYHQKRNVFGTVALFTNLIRMDAIEIYQTYKSRNSIEVMFDGMKNVLDADHTYMQDEQTLKGWMFINHIALQWYQCLYLELKEKGLLKKYSVNDYIQILTDIKKIKINGDWHFNEVTSYTQKLVKKIGIEVV
jgi:transposase